MAEQRIRWYLCPLVPHPSGDPEMPKTPHSFSWRGYGRRTHFPVPGKDWCLLRSRTTLVNHDKLTVPISPLIAFPRLNTLLADAPMKLKQALKSLALDSDLDATGLVEAALDKIGRRLEPSFDRQRIRLDTVQDGVVVKESEMVEE